MDYRSLFLLLFAYMLTTIAASSLSSLLPRLAQYDEQKSFTPIIEKWSPYGNHHEDQNQVVILRRTTTRPSSPRTGTSEGVPRSRSQPNLGVIGGGVRAKGSRSRRRARASASPDRLSEGSRATESTLRAATIRSTSTERTARYESHPAFGTPLRAMTAGSPLGRSSIWTSSTGSLSQDSPPGRGNDFIHASLGASLGSPHGSLSGFEGVLSPARSVQSLRSTIGDSIASSSGRSNAATSPGTSRGSLPSGVSLSSSAGMPSLFEAMAMLPSSSTFPTSTSLQRRPTQDRGRIHDSPSSMRSVRLAPMAAYPAIQNSRSARPSSITFQSGQQQVPPESPASRIGSLEGEANSSLDDHSDRGSRAESLDLRLGRLRFGP